MKKKKRIYKIRKGETGEEGKDFGVNLTEHTNPTRVAVRIGKPDGYVPPEEPKKPKGGLALMGGGYISHEDRIKKQLTTKKNKGD